MAEPAIEDNTDSRQGEDLAIDNGDEEEEALGVEEPEEEEEEDNEAEAQPEEVADVPRPILGPIPILGQYDPARMILTTQEREWALEIKETIEAIPELDNLSDFWYAQLALIEHDDLEAALRRAYQLQEIRQEYNIVESYECARRAIHQAMKIYPNFFLSFTFLDGNYVGVSDLAQISTVHQLTSEAGPEGLHVKLRETYYSGHMYSVDMEAIRRGCIWLAECGNMGSDNATRHNPIPDLTLFRKIWHVFAAYPFKPQKAKHFHTGVFANLLVSMLRRFVPSYFTSTFEMGCQCDAGTLDRIYLTPTPKAANQRVLLQLEEALRLRYHNEATFSL